MSSSADEPQRALGDMPSEVLERIVACIEHVDDVASINAVARLFRGAHGGGRSPVELALRERARARGHEPVLLPADACTWTAELLAREHVLARSRAHAHAVASSSEHNPAFSALVGADGRLYTCGEEWSGTHPEVAAYGACPQLGHPSAPGARPVLVPACVASLGAVRVCAVAAGQYHLLALSEAGAVYGCGDNKYGQLGLGDREARSEFTRVSAPAVQLAVCISAGATHSLALTAAGAAYSWGLNGCGQLGHGDTEERWEPTRIEALADRRVGGLSAGRAHSLLLSLDGAVFSCGYGYCGQLGHGDTQYQHAPRRVEALAGARAVHVSAGNCHSLVVEAAGSVYAFGAGEFGCLGRADLDDAHVPARVEALAGVRAVCASAGCQCSAVLDADGSVRVFGHNDCGQLGLGQCDYDVALPVRVEALAAERVVGCAFGRSHAFFLTADGLAHACGEQSAALGNGTSGAVRRPKGSTPARSVGLIVPLRARPGL